jgi:hypothetical protein
VKKPPANALRHAPRHAARINFDRRLEIQPDARPAVYRQTFDLEAKAPLARLRVKLESNLASLQTHLTAVAEIAAVIARAIQNHESDGTYTATRSATVTGPARGERG